MAKVFLSSSEYWNLIKKIDKSLKRSGKVSFQYKDYQRSYGKFAGSKITYTMKTAYAVKRDDEMLVDANGQEYSIIGDCVSFQA